MNALAEEGNKNASARDAMLTLLRDATAALETHDQESFDQLIETIASLRERQLAETVARLARRIQAAMNQIDVDSRLACIAGREIPDARSHLDFVVRMTEEAAHRTLDLVDHSRVFVDNSQRAVDGLLPLLPEGATDVLSDNLQQMRATLSELSQAQEYQDLSGQVIRRVIKLVLEIQNALTLILEMGGIDIKEAVDKPIVREQGAALGPRPESASSQQDADDLLADLGL